MPRSRIACYAGRDISLRPKSAHGFCIRLDSLRPIGFPACVSMLRFFYMDASCCISYAVAEAIKAGSVSQAQGGSPLEPSPAGKSLALLGAAVQVQLYKCDIAACVARDTFVAS